MAITMKSEYAIKIMVLLGSKKKRMTAKEITIECYERLPLEFAEKILAELSKKGFLKAHRGRNGGYEIAKPLEKITVYDIVSSVDNLTDAIKCFADFGNRSNAPETCTVSKVWDRVLAKMKEAMKGITLKELVDDYIARCKSVE